MENKYEYLIKRAKTKASALMNGLVIKASFIYDTNSGRLKFLQESLTNELDRIEKNVLGDPWIYDGCEKFGEAQLCEHIDRFLDEVKRNYRDIDPHIVISAFLKRYFLIFSLKDEVSSSPKKKFNFIEIFVEEDHAEEVKRILREEKWIDNDDKWARDTTKGTEVKLLYLVLKEAKLLKLKPRTEKFILIAFCKEFGLTIAEHQGKGVFVTIRALMPSKEDKIPRDNLALQKMKTKFDKLSKEIEHNNHIP